MCAINPTHKKRLILDVYTSQDVSEHDFLNKVWDRALKVEQALNEKADLRWHLKETTQKAD